MAKHPQFRDSSFDTVCGIHSFKDAVSGASWHGVSGVALCGVFDYNISCPKCPFQLCSEWGGVAWHGVK